MVTEVLHIQPASHAPTPGTKGKTCARKDVSLTPGECRDTGTHLSKRAEERRTPGHRNTGPGDKFSPKFAPRGMPCLLSSKVLTKVCQAQTFATHQSLPSSKVCQACPGLRNPSNIGGPSPGPRFQKVPDGVERSAGNWLTGILAISPAGLPPPGVS